MKDQIRKIVKEKLLVENKDQMFLKVAFNKEGVKAFNELIELIRK